MITKMPLYSSRAPWQNSRTGDYGDDDSSDYGDHDNDEVYDDENDNQT